MTEITTMQVSVANKDELEKLKVHPNQSYDEVITMLLEFYEQKGGRVVKR